MGLFRRSSSNDPEQGSPATPDPGPGVPATENPAAENSAPQDFTTPERGDLGSGGVGATPTPDAAVPANDDIRQQAEALVTRAQTEMRNGNWEEAWRVSLAGTENPLAAPMSMVHLAVMSADAGNFDQAREWATRAAATQTDPAASEHARRMLPQIEAAQRQASGPDAAREPAPGEGPQAAGDDPALLELAEISAEMGDVEQARSIYRGVANNPNPEYASIALFNWGNLEYGQRFLPEALDLYERSARCNQPTTRVIALFNAGNAARDLQRWDVARTHYRGVVEAGDPDLAPRAMLCLAGVAHVVGDVDGERDWLTQASASGHPEISPRASELLAR